VRADGEERRVEATLAHRLAQVRDLRVELQLDAHVDDAGDLAPQHSRGSRYWGMPKRIMPPAIGPRRGSSPRGPAT
jgi:hypothetical protein